MKGTAYLLQAALISFWWIGLLTNQNFYDAFQFPGIHSIAFNSFLLPDILIIAILSIARAYFGKQEIEFVILGGFAFATLYCINASILTQGGFLGTTIMILGLCYNCFLVFEKLMFRESNTKSFTKNWLKTIVQMISIWLITLVLFPILIMESSGGIPLVKETNKLIGLSFFLICSVLGICSAYFMVKKGEGTPLPLDQTQKLVVAGPYKYVRNPMAIAGVGQVVAISIIFSSIPILLYALLGAVLWELVVKPIEEKDMELRFGLDYKNYRGKVGCWIPKITKRIFIF